ncbi:MAG: RluA family pseudouridine synthase [Mogibacterium sp.]|nr:RluA family pseudouridine synthase [Mogibacterium sp.]MBR2541078.1 RluA family pseudouridine synthase [Mogibacterium sp.]
MAKYEHIVTNEEVGLTINQILRANYKFSSRFRTKMKYQSLVDLNGVQSPGYLRPEAGDVIGVRLPDETSDFPPEDIPLDIVYEDDDLILINKQPGIIVHPTKGHPDHTIANGVMKYMADTHQSFKVRFANRIDMDTTGIIIVAKNANAQNDLSDQMRHNAVVKKYIALVEGTVEQDHFTIELPIGRPTQESIRREVMTDGGKNAVSEVRVIERFESAKFGPHSLVEVLLHTGRTHQIRVHLSHIGHIIAGDELYGGSTDLIGRQALHAYHIEFTHPVTREYITFETDYPEDIRRAIEELR